MNRYDSLCEQRSAQGYSSERNDCTVTALAAVTGHTYDSAHMVLAYHGRRNGRGWKMHARANANKVLGFYGLEAFEVDLYKLELRKGSRLTPASVGRWLPRGRYLVFTRGHVLALVDGEVVDWTRRRGFWVWRIYKIEERI